MKSRSLLLVAAAFFLSTGWTIRELVPFPEGGSTGGHGINKLGQAVGSARSEKRGLRAVYWDAGGTLHELPTPVGFGYESSGWGINDAGVIVGDRLFYSFPARHYGFIWRPGDAATTDLPSTRNSIARAINASEDVAGFWDDARGLSQPVIWRRGDPAAVTTLRPAFFGIGALDLADQPVAVGDTTTAAGRPRRVAFLWIEGRSYELGTLGGDNSFAKSVAITGWPDQKTIHVAGDSEVKPGSTNRHPFLWNRGVMTDLGMLPGAESCSANAVNGSLDVVGWCIRDSTAHAFLWQDGVMHDLNSFLPPKSGWILHVAWDINAFGQIVGEGRLNGALRGFVLTP